LQGVALSREVMDEEFEKEFKKCNGMNAVMKVAEGFQKALTVEGEREVSPIDVDDGIAAAS